MTWKSRPRCTRHHGLDFGNRSRDRSPRDATVGGDDEVILETDAPHRSTRIDPIFNKVLLDVRIISERFVQQDIYEVASRFNRETITFFQNGRGSAVLQTGLGTPCRRTGESVTTDVVCVHTQMVAETVRHECSGNSFFHHLIDVSREESSRN